MSFLLCLHLVQGSRLRWRLRRLFQRMVFSYRSLPLQGKVPRRGGQGDCGMKDSWNKVSQSLVTSHSIIRRKGSAYMCGIRSFGSVPTYSGWEGSHIERFRPLRMTIREGGWALIWEICCVFWNQRCYITIRVAPWRRGAPKAQDGSTQRCEKLCETTRFP